MHPASRASICGMLEMIRHACNAVEAQVAAESNYVPAKLAETQPAGDESKYMSNAEETLVQKFIEANFPPEAAVDGQINSI
jgi:hypothetical protein